jgi:thiamine biosynthesis lipoprotein
VRATFRAMACDVDVAGASDAELDAIARLFAEQDARFSRFRSGSELSRVNRSAGDPLLVSAPFARMLAAALAAARATSGLVTPAVGAAVVAAGYDRDFEELAEDLRPPDDAEVPSWRRLRLAGRWLFRDGPVTLDLNGVVKSATVDDALGLVRTGTVSAGGDVATSRPVVVALPDGESVVLDRGGLATSGVDRRRWRRGGVEQHHLIDPFTARPVASPWLQVTVAAGTCLAADVAAKAALLLGPAGPAWLDRRGLPGRFLSSGGVVEANATWALAAHRRAA